MHRYRVRSHAKYNLSVKYSYCHINNNWNDRWHGGLRLHCCAPATARLTRGCHVMQCNVRLQRHINLSAPLSLNHSYCPLEWLADPVNSRQRGAEVEALGKLHRTPMIANLMLLSPTQPKSAIGRERYRSSRGQMVMCRDSNVTMDRSNRNQGCS
jgi:hypothetical protein